MRSMLKYLTLSRDTKDPRSLRRKFYRKDGNKYKRLPYDVKNRCVTVRKEVRCEGTLLKGMNMCFNCYAKARKKEHGKNIWNIGKGRPPKGRSIGAS